MQAANQRRPRRRKQIADALRHAGQGRRLLRVAGAQAHERQPQDDARARTQAQQSDPQCAPCRHGNQTDERHEGCRRRAERRAALILQPAQHRRQEQRRHRRRQLQKAVQRARALGRIAGIQQYGGEPAHRPVEHERIDAQVQRDLPGQRRLPQAHAMRRMRGRRRRRRVVRKLGHPQQQADQRQRQHAQRRKPPAAIGQAGQGNRDSRCKSRSQAHGQHVGGSQAGDALGKIALEQAGQQHIPQGDARADDCRSRIEPAGAALRAQGDAQGNQQHRREQGAFQPEASRQACGEQRHHRESQQRQRNQHSGGRGR